VGIAPESPRIFAWRDCAKQKIGSHGFRRGLRSSVPGGTEGNKSTSSSKIALQLFARTASAARTRLLCPERLPAIRCAPRFRAKYEDAIRENGVPGRARGVPIGIEEELSYKGRRFALGGQGREKQISRPLAAGIGAGIKSRS
jgi:hypothetical protein